MKKQYFLFCIFIFLPFVLCGKVYFRHIGKSDGLSQISVMSICQDGIGRMWFGTLEGLNCYDGSSMQVFQSSKYPLVGNNIQNIVCDNSGNIFFTSDSRLIRYDYKKGEFHDMKKRVPFIYSDGNRVWIAFKNNILKWNEGKKEFLPVFAFNSNNHDSFIKCFYIDTNDVFWIGTVKGLFKIDDTEKNFPVCIIPDTDIYSLYKDSKNRLWVAAYRNGMYRIEDIADDKIHINHDLRLSNNDVRCFIEDNNGNIWAGTFEGLNKIDSLDNITSYHKENIPGSLKHSSIFSLFKDKQGTIWIGTYYGGVNYFNPHTDIFHHYAEDKTKEYCLNFGYVGDMVEDKRGDLWICTEGGGLNHLNRKTGVFTYYFNDSSNKDFYFPNLKCIEYDKESDCLYIGTHKKGLLCFDINTKKVNFRDTKYVGNVITDIILRDNSLYVLSGRGLFVKDLSENKYSVPINGTVGATAFFVDSNDNLWLSINGRLLKYNVNKCKTGGGKI